MGRIASAFQRLRSRKKAALIPYIMAGDPDLKTTEALVLALEGAGADLVELGVPFSDPVADGPVIQKAAERALKQKTSLRAVLDLVASLRNRTQIPLILMTYYNPIHRYGPARLAADAAACGVDGVIVPDLPPEEAGVWLAAAGGRGLDTIFLLAPTSTPARIRLVSRCSQGFIYYVSLTGITGAALKSLGDVREKARKVRRQSGKPVAVGFGVSGPEQAAEIARWADGVVVGSAVVRLVESHLQDPRLVPAVEEFVRRLHRAVHA